MQIPSVITNPLIVIQQSESKVQRLGIPHPPLIDFCSALLKTEPKFEIDFNIVIKN